MTDNYIFFFNSSDNASDFIREMPASNLSQNTDYILTEVVHGVPQSL
jgi:hypothetical protein